MFSSSEIFIAFRCCEVVLFIEGGEIQEVAGSECFFGPVA